MVIYKCTFPNGKIYIGQTSRDFNLRKREHKSDSNNKNNIRYNSPFYRAIRKYGWNNLIWEIIDYAHSLDELNFKEINWIQYYKSYLHLKESNGYNVSLGGNSNLGYKAKESTKNKIRESGLGEKNSNAKLSYEDVLNILDLIKSGWKQKDIAIKYNVGESLISKIKNGTRWVVTNV